ncbi:MAG: Rne/Rng family ribonuclease, partial [Bdellovibrionales bacterium]
LKELDVAKGMSVILRTAGVTRTKAEIKRDLEYLMRLWDNIRSLTLESSAPALVYEEANLVKRAVRDLYTRDVEDIIVSGEEAYKSAKDFMKMMIPSHVKRVKEFKDENTSLFQKYKIETQIAEIGETSVRLKSGGYLVINPTEALVSIDVNSGKATKERHIEETALKTNLEAAEEVARQLRLRDLGGLVVIDFIDMEDRRNNGKVERKMRESLSGDRARIQVGRISSFGLMELSRQRMNPSLTESQFETCKHCEGTGRTRTADAASVMLLRAIEDEAAKGRAAEVIVHVSSSVALYVLNFKRGNLSEIESRYGLKILIRVDEELIAGGFRVEVSKPAEKDSGADDRDDDDEDSDGEGKSGRNRRGRRGGRRRGRRDDDATDTQGDSAEGDSDQPSGDTARDSDDQDEKPKRGRRKKSEEASGDGVDAGASAEEKEEKPKKTSSRGRGKAADKAEDVVKDSSAVEKSEDKVEEKGEKPKRGRRKKADVSNDDDSQAAATEAEKPLTKKPAAKKSAPKDDTPKDYETVNEAPKTKKKGWWNRGG